MRVELEESPDLGAREARFIAWLKRNRAGKTLKICRKKLLHLGLSENALESFPDDMICIQRQYGEEFVRLHDRKRADEFAMAHEVLVLHHAQHVKQKKYLL